jgi:hypothetical protein
LSIAAPARADTDLRPAARANRPADAWYRRPLVACLLLLAAYCSLSLLNDPHAFLGTDTGGKVATLRAMDARGDLKPDLGYWAERWDPTGIAHPISLTSHIGKEWVNVTTLPMIYATYPFYELFGLRALLLFPMLGGVATALAARALARRMGGNGDAAFWLIGLATPVAVYALDFWEHTIGLALMAWAVFLAVDLARGRAGWRAALGVGLLFGAAATMRTEALVYGAVTGLVVAALLVRAHRRGLFRIAAAGAFGAAVPILANRLLEQWVLGTGFRTGRADSTVASGGQALTTRVDDAITTTLGLNHWRTPTDWLIGGMIVGCIAIAVVLFTRRSETSALAGVGCLFVAGVILFGRFSDGLGFVPGLLTASPLVVGGLVLAWRRPETRLPAAIAVLALPLVWAFQYSGGAAPQWGARYELLSGFLLATCAVAALPRLPRMGAVALVAAAVTVTACGIGWMSVRTHGFGNAAAAVDRIHGPVLVTDLPHFLREAGAFYTPDRHWLTAETGAEVKPALRVLERSGAGGFTLVTRFPTGAPATMGPYHRVDRGSLPLVSGVVLATARYQR